MIFLFCLQIPTLEKVEKSKRARDDKHRKKDDKSVEHVLRALNSLNTSEEKLAAMCKKYADLVNDHKAMQVEFNIFNKIGRAHV